MRSLADVYDQLNAADQPYLEKRAALQKQAEEDHFAGRIMARGFMDELVKLAEKPSAGPLQGPLTRGDALHMKALEESTHPAALPSNMPVKHTEDGTFSRRKAVRMTPDEATKHNLGQMATYGTSFGWERAKDHMRAVNNAKANEKTSDKARAATAKNRLSEIK